MSATRCYDKSGLTMNSQRGTAVQLMCREVEEASQKIAKARKVSVVDGIIHGSVTAGYISWLRKQPKHTEPIGKMRFQQLVSAFMPLFLKGETGAFNLINETGMDYTTAAVFGSEAAKFFTVAKRNGIKVKLSK